jgi:ABC-2 type transport system ATP-binding protein
MIRIENMSFIYPKGRRNIHTNLSLNLEENKIYGLLGKNGTGKSTLLYLIAGLLKPTKGTITMDAISDETGEAVNHSTFERHPEVLRETFFVNEEYTLPPLTLDEWSNSLGGFYPTYSEEMFRQCLADFDITGNPKLTTLSMGQQKKIIISFALASGVKYLFMDEPTNGLDIPSKAQFRKVVSSCMTEERTIIISTHQVHDVEFLLDHIIIIDNDRLLLNATTSEITDRFVFEYRIPGSPTEGVIYQEPTLQGNATMAYRKSTDHETNINLELLFNATVKGLFI